MGEETPDTPDVTTNKAEPSENSGQATVGHVRRKITGGSPPNTITNDVIGSEESP